jgi:hypothetical protein
VLMRRLLGTLIIFSMVLGLGVLGAAPVQSQSTRVAGCRYFPATGHNVQSEFLAFFDRFHGETFFGQPRTEALVEDGLTVQYFERVRMELHPSDPPLYRVQLTLLGELLGYSQPPISSDSIPPFSNPQRRYYPQTGHTLSYVFLQYYDRHGGIDVFGYPITEMVTEAGCTVQYFQRGKMEWHPENPLQSQVTLGALGNEYILRTNVNQQFLAPLASVCSSQLASPTSIPVPAPTSATQPTALSAPTVSGTESATLPAPAGSGPVAQVEFNGVVLTAGPQPVRPQAAEVPPAPQISTDFSVSAGVKYRITGQGGTQTLHVRAVDSQGRWVANAAVQAIVHFPAQGVVARGTTDAAGSCCLTFSIGSAPPGYTVMIEIRVTHAGRTVTTRTSFLVWS